MSTTALIQPPPARAAKPRGDAGPPASRTPTFGDMLAETLPLIAVVVVAGPPAVFSVAGVVLAALVVAGPFVLIVTAVAAVLLALIAVALLIVLTGAALAAPLLLVRRLRNRRPRRLSIAPAPRTSVLADTR